MERINNAAATGRFLPLPDHGLGEQGVDLGTVANLSGLINHCAGLIFTIDNLVNKEKAFNA